MEQQTCPSCGAKLDVLPGNINLVCPYCNTVLMIERGVLTDTGEKGFMIPFPSAFENGKYFYAIQTNTGNNKLGNKLVDYKSEKEYVDSGKGDYLAKLYVYGHVRYMNDSGFWEDWFVRNIDDKTGLIPKDKDLLVEENEGMKSIFLIDKIQNSYGQDSTKLNQFNSELGSKDIGTSWQGYFIQEQGIANIDGREGQLPFLLYNEKTIDYKILYKDGKAYKVEYTKSFIVQYQSL